MFLGKLQCVATGVYNENKTAVVRLMLCYKRGQAVAVKEPVATAVAVLVFNEDRLLLGKRIKQQVFEGWQCPGGYLQKGDSIEAAARYYCLQKAGIEITDLKAGPYTNNIFPESLSEVSLAASLRVHTISLYQVARLLQVKNIEKFEDKKIKWSWFNLDELPSPQFLPLKLLLQQYDIRQFAHI